MFEKENLNNYEEENKWLNSKYNKTSIYVPGKAITENEDGEMKFYYLEDINNFVYGQDVMADYLFNSTQLEDKEKEAVARIKSTNALLHQQGLHAFYIRKEKSQDYLFFLSEEQPEVFFKVKYENYIQLNEEKLPASQATEIEKAIEIII